MHIEKIKLNKFRVLQDMEVRFLVPPDGANDRGNTVNVVAGVNGTGKTSLLEAIYQAIENPAGFINKSNIGDIDISCFEVRNPNAKGAEIYHHIQNLLKDTSASETSIHRPCLIFLTSQLSFKYQAVSQLLVKHLPFQQIDNSKILGNAEFYIKEFILSHERKSRVADPEKRSKEATEKFNSHFLETELLTKLDGLDDVQFNRPIFTNAAGDKVTIDQLSDGEKQLYGRVISLMILDPHNSVILIDEPEIALHPSWQQQIMSVYSKIGKNNQFIVATHSPQIIASTNYENLIILDKQDGKISAL